MQARSRVASCARGRKLFDGMIRIGYCVSGMVGDQDLQWLMVGSG